MVDLSKTIKINKTYEISYGRILLAFFITFFEALGIIAFNNWILHPSVFFLIANAFLTIGKQAETDKLEQLIKRISKLEEK